MKKKTRITSLPELMVNDLKKIGLSKSQLNNAIRFIDLVKNKSFRNYKSYDIGVKLPNTYLSKVFSNHFYEWLNPLKQSGIIQVLSNEQGKEIYSKKLHIPKSYNLNPLYFSNTNIQYQINTYKSPVFEETPEYQDFKMYKQMVSEDLKDLDYNFKKLRDIAIKKIEQITIESFNTGETITADYFPVIIKKPTSQHKYWMTKVNALRIAKEENMTLIQDHKIFYITNAEDFIKIKRNVYTDAYIGSIEKIEKGYWYGDRNSTNNRLDSNITNLCGDLMEEIIKENNLVQFDLANSQFAILSHILKQNEELNKKDDFLTFKELSESGKLYTYIQEVLQLENRKQAKIMLFELLFSSEKNKSENKKKITLLFPSVVKWIDDFKKINGYENFAIMLQKEESKIFIDDIYLTLKEQGLFCLTKHDSIIVRKRDEKVVEEFLRNYFNSINFNAKIVK